ncbi:MAG: PhzF family phenazine biosynthesis protein [Cyanobacteriota bacterium]|nr:PhzF family phenazine biosynthesis protein [Cyanobacteriota bacterium]
MVSGLPAVLVEAFSAEPLGGNGAAVVRLAQAAPADWMQRVAARLRQSETAFLLEAPGGWALRWFTPTKEVPLCGHATLAALLALHRWSGSQLAGDIRFLTRSGPLQGRLGEGGSSGGADGPPRVQLELPTFALRPEAPPSELSGWLSARLGHGPERFWRSGLGYAVALLPPAAPLAGLEGVAAALSGPCRDGLVLMQALPPGADRPRVIGAPADYQLRFFAPGLGIDEDPVTGSAHALVAPYWLERCERQRVVGWQCSDRPGGMVCEASSSGMIRLTGCGHLLWEGTLWAEPEPGSTPSAAAAEWALACGLPKDDPCRDPS